MFQGTQFLVQKLLGYFCLFRCGLLTGVLTYIIVFFSSVQLDDRLSLLVPFQIYVLFSFTANVKKLLALDVGHCSNILWSLVDNGFCAVFYLFQIGITSYKLIVIGNEYLDFEFVTVILIFHCFLGLIHSFVFVCDKTAYSFIKEYTQGASCPNYEPSNVARNREMIFDLLHGGYACPNAADARSSVFGPSKHCTGVYHEVEIHQPIAPENNYAEARGTSTVLNTFKKVGVYEDVRPKFVYDEVPAHTSLNEYDELRAGKFN